MPDWIAASLLFFGIAVVCVALAIAITAGISAGFPLLTLSLAGGVVLLGMPTFYYVILQ